MGSSSHGAHARRAARRMDGADDLKLGRCSVTKFFVTQATHIPVQYTIQTVLDPVFNAESDGDLRFEPKPRPDTVMWIANLQLDGGSTPVRRVAEAGFILAHR